MDHVEDQLLAALALGDASHLPHDEVREAASHLAVCERCAEDLRGLKETFALFSATDDDVAAPPEGVWETVAEEIAREHRRTT